jgi:hypothetical protein
MRAALLAALLLALAAAAELVGTPSLDIAYWATLSQVSAASPSGTWWSIPAQYPLIASDPLGRCVAVADRPYLLAASINSTAGTVSVKYAYVSIIALYESNGYLLYAKAFNDTAVTAIATDCEATAVGAMDGRVYVLPANETYALGSPITALAVLNGTVYAGTEDGRLYEISPAGPQLLAAHPGYVFKIAATARGDIRLLAERGAGGIRLPPRRDDCARRGQGLLDRGGSRSGLGLRRRLNHRRGGIRRALRV